MNLLFFDCETTGTFDWGVPPQFHDKYPRIIDLAWCGCNLETQKILFERQFLIKPEGWEMPATQWHYEHGYSTEQNTEKGEPISFVMDYFTKELKYSSMQIAHNIVFDKKVIQSEYHRMFPGKLLEFSNTFCLMHNSRRFVDARTGDGRKKPPKLAELYLHLFGKMMENEHTALGDVRAKVQCFFELINRRLIFV